MAYSSKVQGTRYEMEIDSSGGTWSLAAKLNNVTDQKINLKNNSLKTIREGVIELLKIVNVKMNDFQMDLLAKDLYGGGTGDRDLSKHEKSMQEIEQKKNMMNDPSFQDSLVSEFKSSFKIKEEAPKIDKDKLKSKPEPQTSNTESGENPEMRAMMSEMSQQIGESKPSPSSSSTSQSQLNKHVEIDTRVSSVDVEDLIQELKDTKELLAGDIAKVQLRMEKIDNIILKLSAISSKL